MSRKEAISREVAFFVLCALVAIAVFASACNGVAVADPPGTCKLVYCGSYAEGTVITTLTPFDMPATVVACRNDECRGGVVERGDASSGFVCTFPEGGPVCEVRSLEAIDFVFRIADDDARNGDRYSVQVIARDGTIKGEKHGVAAYAIREPNGPGCGTCRQARL